MHVHRSIQSLPSLRNPVVTMGVFDGVHRGHKQIIERLLQRARETSSDSLVLTFDPHPRIVLQKDPEKLRLITSLEERIELLLEDGVDHLLILPFTAELAALSSGEFITQNIWEPFKPSCFVVGHDHQFGRHGEGNFSILNTLGNELGFSAEQVPALEFEGAPISSSRIRSSLAEGRIDEARAMLGYPYHIFGRVVEGNRVGRSIGFPTANILVTDPYKLIPGIGVYAATAHLQDRHYGGMMNIGYRPTLNENRLSIEIHLFGFQGDLYNQEIKVFLHARLRDEMKFPSVDALKRQLEIDSRHAQEILQNEVAS